MTLTTADRLTLWQETLAKLRWTPKHADRSAKLAFSKAQWLGLDKDQAIQAGYVIEDADAWLTKDVDVLIPGALEGQINAETVKRISGRVRLVAEGANGPTTPRLMRY